MNILLAGDGRRSWDLIHPLLDQQHRVTVINPDVEYCRQIAERFEEVVLLTGESTDLSTLEDAQEENFDRIIAASLFDSENLVICKLYQKVFHAKKTTAIVNCPQNADIFRKLGVTTVIDANAFILSRIQ